VSTSQIAVLVVSSGFAAGLVSGLVALLSGRWERRHRSAERQAVAAHEARLRRETAHDEARDTFLPKARDIAAWARAKVNEIHWQQVGTNHWNTVDRAAVVVADAEAVELLRDIRYGHPTKSVRVAAEGLLGDIENGLSEIVGDTIPDPKFDVALDWFERSERIIEQIHSPEPGSTLDQG
jgi:hypothetical protein